MPPCRVPLFRRLAKLLTAFLIVLASTLIPVSTATADGTGFSAAELEALRDATFRQTFVINIDEEGLSRQKILDNYLDYYAQFGFSEEWVRTAEERTLQVDASIIWTHCGQVNNGGADTACQPAVVAGSQVSRFTELQVLIDSSGHWIALMCGNFRVYSQSIPKVDIAKSDFRVLGVPADMTVNEPVVATVAATVSLVAGDQDSVGFTDYVDLEVPADCSATPRTFSATGTVTNGEPVTLTWQTTIVCGHHSNHVFTARDRLIPQVGVRDVDMSNNSASATAATEVWENHDLALQDVTLGGFKGWG